ncbi:MAG: histidine triad (HIT) family protein [Bacillariaceae sp.]|jgi:histidine triad (HIT) family protein
MRYVKFFQDTLSFWLFWIILYTVHLTQYGDICFVLCFRSITRILSCSAFLSRKSLTATAFATVANTSTAAAISNRNSARTYSFTTALTAAAAAANNNNNNMSDEVQKAKEAAASAGDGDGQPLTIFDKIISGDIPATIIHDDELCLAFRDVNPVSPIHFLVIPKNRDGLTQLSKAREDQKELLGHLTYVAQKLGQKECPDGFRIVINDGKDGAQSVYHLHIVSEQ